MFSFHCIQWRNTIMCYQRRPRGQMAKTENDEKKNEFSWTPNTWSIGVSEMDKFAISQSHKSQRTVYGPAWIFSLGVCVCFFFYIDANLWCCVLLFVGPKRRAWYAESTQLTPEPKKCAFSTNQTKLESETQTLRFFSFVSCAQHSPRPRLPRVVCNAWAKLMRAAALNFSLSGVYVTAGVLCHFQFFIQRTLKCSVVWMLARATTRAIVRREWIDLRFGELIVGVFWHMQRGTRHQSLICDHKSVKDYCHAKKEWFSFCLSFSVRFFWCVDVDTSMCWCVTVMLIPNSNAAPICHYSLVEIVYINSTRAERRDCSDVRSHRKPISRFDVVNENLTNASYSQMWKECGQNMR